MKHSHILNRLSALLLAALLLFCPLAVRAEEGVITAPLTTLAAPQDLTVSFWFDAALPSVTLIAPSGARYPVSTETPGMQCMISAEYALVTIAAAPAGDWLVEYTMGSNTEFDFAVMGMAENLWIQYITATPDGFNNVLVEFLAERGEPGESYRYELYLTYEGESATQVLLREGYAATGEVVNFPVSLSDYNSYEKYQLLLQVEMTTSDVTLFDFLESEPFSFTNTSLAPAPSHMALSVDVTSRMLTVDWSEAVSYRYNGYRLLIAGSDGTVIFGSDLDSSATKLSQYVSETYSTVTVSLYGIDGALLSQPLVKEVSILGKLSLLTPQLTASAQAQIQSHLPKDSLLTVRVNDTDNEFVSDGSQSTVAVALNNGENTLTAFYTENDITYTLTAEIYKDGYPPVIQFYEPYADMSFLEPSTVLLGSVGDATRLLMNSTPVELVNGQFSIQVTLAEGANEFLFEAYDAAGNRSTYPMTLYGGTKNIAADGITGSTEKGASWIALALGGGLALGFVVFAIVLCARQKKLKAFSTPTLLVFFAFFSALTVGGYLYHLLEHQKLQALASSYDFSLLAGESLEQAYALLLKLEKAAQTLSTHLTLMIVALSLTVLAVAAHVILSLIRGKKGDSKDPKEKKEKKSKKEQAQKEEAPASPQPSIFDPTPQISAPEAPAEGIPSPEASIQAAPADKASPADEASAPSEEA